MWHRLVGTTPTYGSDGLTTMGSMPLARRRRRTLIGVALVDKGNLSDASVAAFDASGKRGTSARLSMPDRWAAKSLPSNSRLHGGQARPRPCWSIALRRSVGAHDRSSGRRAAAKINKTGGE